MRILLAEDEEQLARVVTMAIQSLNYTVDVARNGQEAVDLAATNAYDAIILDIMMPVKDGITALKEIRARGDRTYIMMLTAKAEIDDRVLGLDTGADDYLTKPFSLKELLARLRSIERRNEAYDTDTLTFGDLSLNTNEGTLVSHNSISLSPKETRMLQYLVLNAEKELSITTLLTHTWDDDDEEADEDDVWFTISYLRQKLSAIGSTVSIIGAQVGPFKLQAPPASA